MVVEEPRAHFLGHLLLTHSFNEAVFYTMYQTRCVGLTVQHRGAAGLWEKQCTNRPAKPGHSTVTGKSSLCEPKAGL